MMDAAALMSQARDAYSAGMQNRFSTQAGRTSDMNIEQAREAGAQFEAFFIGQMFEYMNTGLDGDSYFSGGHAEDMWRSMLNQEYGKEMAKSGSLGIADAVARSLIQAQADATADRGTPAMAPPPAEFDQSTLSAPAAARNTVNTEV